MASFVPDIGDIVWIDFDPQAGREQAGRRPALVLTPAAYNDRIGLLICCPLTSKVKNYPFEVAVDGGSAAILADHVKSVDWRSRNARPKSRISPDVVAEVRAKILTLIA